MIKIEVDEAYAFDMLAIAKLKSYLSEENLKTFNSLYANIRCELGEIKMSEIVVSEEYRKLYKANEEVFSYVDELNKGNSFITGIEVHQANTDRYRYKKELQMKFFGNELKEQKTKF